MPFEEGGVKLNYGRRRSYHTNVMSEYSPYQYTLRVPNPVIHCGEKYKGPWGWGRLARCGNGFLDRHTPFETLHW